MMKPLRHFTDGVGSLLLCVLSAGLLATGCQTEPETYKEIKGVTDASSTVVDVFRVGDQVMLIYNGASGEIPIMQNTKLMIKEDGTISPPMLKPVVAASRTPGQVQAELQDKYNSLFANLTVSVVPADRYYYVTGEVKKPGPEPYLGETDIIKALSAAGDVTDFGNKKKVRLTRSSGQTQIINVKKILEDPRFDIPVYPGDKIYVPRSIF